MSAAAWLRGAAPPAACAVAMREVAGAPSWQRLTDALHAAPGAWLLESALVREPLGRFSFAGAYPYATLAAAGPRVALHVDRPVRPDLPAGRHTWRGDPFAAVRRVLPRTGEAPGVGARGIAESAADAAARDADAPSAGAGARVEATEHSPTGARGDPAHAHGLPFVGGAVGWLGYELAGALERVAFPAPEDRPFPELLLRLVDRVVAFDAVAGRTFACALGFAEAGHVALARDRAERAAGALAGDVARGTPERMGVDTPHAVSTPAAGAAPRREPPVRLRDAATGLTLGAWFDEGSYAKHVEAILERIVEGDVYQANLTHRLEHPFAGDPWRLYRRLARENPAPFAAWLSLGTLGAVAGSSPERFVRVGADGSVESRPIKGTRPRGATRDADLALARALATSEKDRAENLMIVDLVRNDLGRVCETGSVRVPALMTVESYATVHQLVSSVTGRLAAGRGVVDLLRAAFPPGSMTGAPKIAAMEILAGLEPVRRGIYSGALGYLDARGGADLSVVIRTMLLEPDRATLHVGGGIVADSDPRAEWQESLDKARALLDALAAEAAGG